MCFFVLLSHLMGHWCIVPWSTIILQSTPKGYIQLEITIHTFISLNFQVKVHLHTSVACSTVVYYMCVYLAGVVREEGEERNRM